MGMEIKKNLLQKRLNEWVFTSEDEEEKEKQEEKEKEEEKEEEKQREKGPDFRGGKERGAKAFDQSRSRQLSLQLERLRDGSELLLYQLKSVFLFTRGNESLHSASTFLLLLLNMNEKAWATVSDAPKVEIIVGEIYQKINKIYSASYPTTTASSSSDPAFSIVKNDTDERDDDLSLNDAITSMTTLLSMKK